MFLRYDCTYDRYFYKPVSRAVKQFNRYREIRVAFRIRADDDVIIFLVVQFRDSVIGQLTLMI